MKEFVIKRNNGFEVTVIEILPNFSSAREAIKKFVEENNELYFSGSKEYKWRVSENGMFATLCDANQEYLYNYNYEVNGIPNDADNVVYIDPVEAYDVIDAKERIKDTIDNIGWYAVEEVCKNTLDQIPGYFWKIPSSSSGKYHPEDEIVSGGLVKHTLRTIVVLKDLAKSQELTEYEEAICVAALIFHDCCKNGMTDCGYTVHEHPMLAADLVRRCNKRSDFENVAEDIALAIESHSGIWRKDSHKKSEVILPLPTTKLQQVVHLCDMVASRRDIIVKL